MSVLNGLSFPSSPLCSQHYRPGTTWYSKQPHTRKTTSLTRKPPSVLLFHMVYLHPSILSRLTCNALRFEILHTLLLMERTAQAGAIQKMWHSFQLPFSIQWLTVSEAERKLQSKIGFYFKFLPVTVQNAVFVFTFTCCRYIVQHNLYK